MATTYHPSPGVSTMYQAQEFNPNLGDTGDWARAYPFLDTEDMGRTAIDVLRQINPGTEYRLVKVEIATTLIDTVAA